MFARRADPPLSLTWSKNFLFQPWAPKCDKRLAADYGEYSGVARRGAAVGGGREGRNVEEVFKIEHAGNS
ncbi:hypothetical protein JZ751_003427 [Albula glossodonta]|uniref:Uncharacterized protein n=1 Tax=Albula glossodonta TaxID=121402 RepID=A0A8T2NDZ7_9TELE|nr:hypothetical protein JZ751_003427 [Albula glossodonta]